MSRAVFALAILLILPFPVEAQMQENEDARQFVQRRSAEILDIDGTEKKCPEPEEGDEIVVCAVMDNGADQLVFDDQRKTEESGASANANAAGCVPGTGCRLPYGGPPSASFGKRRPPAIPIEDVYAGLPEPEDIVPEGSGAPE